MALVFIGNRIIKNMYFIMYWDKFGFNMSYYIESVLRSIKKLILRLYTSRCEIERICNQGHFAETTLGLVKSLKLSKRLKGISGEILHHKGHLFSISQASREIARIKCIQDSYRMSILVICLKDCYYIKAVLNLVESSRSTKVNLKDPKHARILSEFWTNMMPDAPNMIKTDVSSVGDVDWTAVGFQSKNPESDFRGMGLFGLQQMTFLSKYEYTKADYILKICNHQRRWLPMAATSINISAYLIELIETHKCHRLLINALYHHQSSLQKSSSDVSAFQSIYETINSDYNPDSSSNGQALDGQLLGINREILQIGIDTINTEYCYIYYEFIKFWDEQNPRDIMEFQRLFSLFKAKMESERFRNI